MIPLTKNILIKLASVIFDEVTTTDELIPSGETSSYRSNPQRLSEFTLSRKDPKYVGRAKEIFAEEIKRRDKAKLSEEFLKVSKICNFNFADTIIGSAIFAKKPGDGSAREQAASCQRVLGGCSNIAFEYATKRYRSNLINWGMIPFLCDHQDFKTDDYIFIENIKDFLSMGKTKFDAKLIRDQKIENITLRIDPLTKEEIQIILDGCLINYYGIEEKNC